MRDNVVLKNYGGLGVIYDIKNYAHTNATINKDFKIRR